MDDERALRDTRERRGFTLVEAVVVVVVFAIILAIVIPVLRERERKRLQALADWKLASVFELNSVHAHMQTVDGRDEMVYTCEIANKNSVDLVLKSPELKLEFYEQPGPKPSASNVIWAARVQFLPLRADSSADDALPSKPESHPANRDITVAARSTAIIKAVAQLRDGSGLPAQCVVRGALRNGTGSTFKTPASSSFDLNYTDVSFASSPPPEEDDDEGTE